MNSIDSVSTHLEQMIQDGASKPEIVRSISKMCVGWPYVFGAWGEICTPSGRQRRARDDHPTIVSACQVLSKKKSSCWLMRPGKSLISLSQSRRLQI